jgi:site-specific DNA-methyltransferase (adenine-specific)
VSMPTPAETEASPAADVRLIEGDCRAVLPTLDLDAIDWIVTDPPYGIDFRKGDTGKPANGRKSVRRNTRPISGDDRPFDPSPWLERWPCVFFGADHFHDRLPPGGSWHVWDKRAYSTIEDSFADLEFVWASERAKSEVFEHLWKGVLRASENQGRKYHVSQKPVRLMCRILEKFTKPGDLILDPYAGSGSTLVACLKTGRRGIGIEVDPAYIPTARSRIASARLPMFDPPVPEVSRSAPVTPMLFGEDE